MTLSIARRWSAWPAVLGAVALVLSACAGGQPQAQAPAEPQPAAPAVQVPLIVVFDMVQGTKNVPEAERGAKVCVLKSRYARNEEVIWRIKVVDPTTGQAMDDTQLERVAVELSDGQAFEAKYGPHPKNDPTDFFWATGWTIPENYPAGIVNFTVVAKAKDGREGQVISFNVAPALLTVLDEAVPVLTTQ